MAEVAFIKTGVLLGVYREGQRIEFIGPYTLLDDKGEPFDTEGPVTILAQDGVTYRDWEVVAVVDAGPNPPVGKEYQFVYTIEMVDGVPTKVYQYADVPWPVLSQRQFWKALALTGMHVGVTAHIDTLSLEDQIEAKQAMEYQHDHWLITDTRPLFGLDDTQFRDLWFWAATL